ncbi:hypothetical protein CEXT_554091 [Caerostris extrusa]|uniref:Uncharacterized protein n=1 Tax=Caerostris extrusa TaxID=172846 RepID=A0AAV4PB97_CAEEX|nr:hypothetical protein CEXT_554091 [Caerostris extrusa]
MSTDYLELTGIQRGRRQSHALSSAFTETIGRDQHKYDNDQNLDELQRFLHDVPFRNWRYFIASSFFYLYRLVAISIFDWFGLGRMLGEVFPLL